MVKVYDHIRVKVFDNEYNAIVSDVWPDGTFDVQLLTEPLKGDVVTHLRSEAIVTKSDPIDTIENLRAENENLRAVHEALTGLPKALTLEMWLVIIKLVDEWDNETGYENSMIIGPKVPDETISVTGEVLDFIHRLEIELQDQGVRYLPGYEP